MEFASQNRGFFIQILGRAYVKSVVFGLISATKSVKIRSLQDHNKKKWVKWS